MLKITEIAFGLEKAWKHRNRDAVCVPHYVSFVALMVGIAAGAGSGLVFEDAGQFEPMHLVFWGSQLALLGALFWMRRRVAGATFKGRKVAAWLGVWCALWLVTGVYHGIAREPVRMPAGARCEVAAEIVEISPGTAQAVIEIRQFACMNRELVKTRFRARMALEAGEASLDAAEVLARGTRFYAAGTFEAFEGPDVPGMYDARVLVRSRGIYGTFRRDWDRDANRRAALRLAEPERSMRRALEIGRRGAYEKLSSVSPEGIMPALVLGASRGIDSGVRDGFGRLGIAHVLAVSGLHFGIIAIVFNFIFIKIFERIPWVMRRWGKSRAAMVCALPMLSIYLFFVGAPISAQRALLMTLICFLARAIARRPERMRALCAAGLVILCISPGAMFDVGFQLSFSAVFGIICALDIEARMIEPRMMAWDVSRGAKKIARYFVSALLVTVCTSLTTAPFVAFHFGRLPVLGIFTNLIVIPYVSLILMPLAMITALSVVLGMPWADFVSQLGSGAERLLVWFADLSVKYIPLESICMKSGLYIAILLGVLAVTLLWRLRLSKCRMIGMSLAVSAVCVCTASDLPERFVSGEELRISFIAMGQADSTLIEFPGGRTMLIDAGSEVGRAENAAERRLLPYLQSRGIRAVDTLVLTHGDYDHVAGVLPLLEQVEVREIWYNGAPAAPAEPNWREVAGALEIPVRDVKHLPRSQAIGGASVDILWPVDDDYTNANEASVVLRVEAGQFSAIFMGDAGADTEAALLQAADVRRTTLLKAGHHGSQGASTEEFLEALRPDYAVFSVGRHNRYHFPHPSAVRRVEAHARAYRTDRSGTVLFRTDGKRLRVQTMH